MSWFNRFEFIDLWMSSGADVIFGPKPIPHKSPYGSFFRLRIIFSNPCTGTGMSVALSNDNPSFKMVEKIEKLKTSSHRNEFLLIISKSLRKKTNILRVNGV